MLTKINMLHFQVMVSAYQKGGEQFFVLKKTFLFFVSTGRRYIRYRGRRCRVRMKKKYFLGRKRIRRFRRRIRIKINRKLRRIKRYRKRWRVRIRRRWCGLRRFGRKWYLRRRRKWRKLKRIRLILRLRRRRIRIRRLRKKWYIRRRKKWSRVKRIVRCTIRYRGRRVKARLTGRKGLRIFRKGRYGKIRRIKFKRKLIEL